MEPVIPELSSYPTVFKAETLNRKGLCPVSSLEHEQKQEAQDTADAVLPSKHSLYFEIHGDGEQKVVLIMGLNTNSFAWSPLVEYLTTVKEPDGKDRYSALVFDNRGVGNSGTPMGPYSTSGMAADVILLLEYVGWTAPQRQLHIVGVSMGGMIALELASRIAARIASLSLLVTTAGGWALRNSTPFKGIRGLVRLTFAKTTEEKVKLLLPILYPLNWLKEPAEAYGHPEITNADFLTQVHTYRIDLARRQTLVGSLSQMAAAKTHYVSPDRLKTIAASIPKVYIMTGDDDNLVRPENSHHLKSCMPEAEFEVWEGSGHGVFGQYPKRFGEKMVQVMQQGWDRRETSPTA
ncbi:hypothetical protein FS837_010780 [Tulasnella sp. UAMH 9824]|nr:hypothetical protein FS837_010780 [Tulasnella sp. UAMH 9824]